MHLTQDKSGVILSNDMDSENKQTASRKIIGPILATVGTGLVVAAVVKILGVGWPWLMLIAGIVCIMLAIFVSVPGSANLLSPIRISKQIRGTWIWWFRRPDWSCSKPTLREDGANQTQSDDQLGRTKYATSLSLTINNKDDFPLKVSFYSLQVNVEQGKGRHKARCSFYPDSAGNVEIKPHNSEPFEFTMHGVCFKDKLVDTTQAYDWGIQGLQVYLNGIGFKHLRKGLYLKPIPTQRIGIV